MTLLQFDEETTRLLEDAYQGSDVTRRRRANFDALELRPGDRVADIGCGPGLLCEELARAVGPNGRVLGLDPSADMRRAAETRCNGRGNVDISKGTAHELPCADASIDKAVSLQVYEYIDDIPGALAETARVLRPGGRIVVGDWHWDMLTWRSDDPRRMRRVLEAWDGHLADRAVPETLPGDMRAQGFVNVTSLPVVFTDTALRSDGVARMMLTLIRGYLTENALMTEADIVAWEEEQHALAAAGRFFFSFVHFVTVGHRP